MKLVWSPLAVERASEFGDSEQFMRSFVDQKVFLKRCTCSAAYPSYPREASLCSDKN